MNNIHYINDQDLEQTPERLASARRQLAFILAAGLIVFITTIFFSEQAEASDIHTTCRVAAANGTSTNDNVNLKINTDNGVYVLNDIEGAANQVSQLHVKVIDTSSIQFVVTVDGQPGVKYVNFSSDIAFSECRPPAARPTTTTTTVESVEVIETTATTTEAPELTTTTVQNTPEPAPVMEQPTPQQAQPATPVEGSPAYTG